MLTQLLRTRSGASTRAAEPLSYSHMKRLTPILAFALIAVPERFAALLAGFGDLPFGVWPA